LLGYAAGATGQATEGSGGQATETGGSSASVSWSPKRVPVSLKPNEATTRVVKLTANSKIGLASIKVTPALARYVTVKPTEIRNLAKGRSLNVTITFALPIDASKKMIEGAIQVRTSTSKAKGATTNSTKLVPSPLPVSIGVVCPCLPPDPGKAGELTLEGIDSNRNGVRDDIERYVALLAPDDPTRRTALINLADAVQDTYLSAGTDISVLADQIVLRVGCVHRVTTSRDASADISELMPRVLNTAGRARGYFLYNESLPSQSFAIPSPSDMTGC
jgi:hypothetical protein